METPFTAHNVILDDGSQTAPHLGYTLDRSPHVDVVRDMATLLYPAGFKGRRLVDLGCLEGGFTTEFARLGFDSSGIEVRKSNFDNCMFVKNRVALDGLRFYNDTLEHRRIRTVRHRLLRRSLLPHRPGYRIHAVALGQLRKDDLPRHAFRSGAG